MTPTRRILMIAIMLSIFAGINFYLARRLYQWLQLLFPNINVWAISGLYVLITLTMVAGIMPLPSGFGRAIQWVSAHWMGIFMYLLLFFLLADFVILFGRLVRIIPSPAPQILRFFAGLLVILLTTGVTCYGVYNANQLKQVSYQLRLNEHANSADLKIVMVSDLHLGAVGSERRLEGIVQAINAQNPDLVCIVGDITNGNYHAIQDPERAIAQFKSITAPLGVYACLGNHDAGSTFTETLGFFKQSNIILLNDESVVIANRLILAGRLDPSPIGTFGTLTRSDTLGLPAEPDLPIIVMDHNPIKVGEYGPAVDLILSGHTHKGQLFPGSLITSAMYVVDHGHYQKDAAAPHIVVSSGAGTWGPPMRVGTQSEIVSITLQGRTS